MLPGYNSGEFTLSKWRTILGGHAIDLKDHHCLTELVITILKMYEGKSKTEAISEISSVHARNIVERALKEHEEYVDVSPSEVEEQVTIEEF